MDGLPTGAIRIVPTLFGFRVEAQTKDSYGETRWKRVNYPVMIKEAYKWSSDTWQKRSLWQKKPKRKKKK